MQQEVAEPRTGLHINHTPARPAIIDTTMDFFDGGIEDSQARLPKGRLLGEAPAPDTELLPFCFDIARIEELQQEERKEGEAVEELSATDHKKLDIRERIEAFRHLGLTTQAEADIR